MVIVMAKHAPRDAVERVVSEVTSLGFTPHLSEGESRTLVGAIGPAPTEELRERLAALPSVDTVVRITKPYKLASREFRRDDSFVVIGGAGSTPVKTGNGRFVVAAGPCGVESREQLLGAAEIVQRRGGAVLRGGAYKPRTSPYAFQGLAEEGLKYLAEAREQTGLAIVTEVMSIDQIPACVEYADVLQIGARNAQNFNLLSKVGQTTKPVLLKRGMSSTLEEFLLAAEYILAGGNPHVMLCERGIRTFEMDYVRNTLPLAIVPELHRRSHLPVVVDPSHGTGKSHLVPDMCKAAVACGADALIIEVHHDPEHAMTDGAQSLNLKQFADMMAAIRRVAAAVDREV